MIIFEAPFCHSMYNIVAKYSNSGKNHVTVATSWMRNSTLVLREFLWFQSNLEYNKCSIYNIYEWKKIANAKSKLCIKSQ